MAAGLPLICTVIEATREWGGKITTHMVDDLVIEAGPDSFLSQKPWALDLCRQLGLSDQLINTNPLEDRAFVYSRGRLCPLPEGLVMVVPSRIGRFVRSGLLSWSGMARMALDLVIPRQPDTDSDESLASFFRRRLGPEAFERLIEPLMAGIYAGDAEQLSLQATFPRFLEMERRHGSLIRGIWAGQAENNRRKGTGSESRTMFVTLRDGLQTLVNAVVAHLEKAGTHFRLGQRVVTIRARSPQAGESGYTLLFENSPVLSADAVVLATPAYVSGQLVRGLNAVAADGLSAIPYASTATVSLAYHRAEVGPSVRGFGFVVPRVEQRGLLAATWTSRKWSHRAPLSHTLVRCYVGGIGREDLLKADDHTVIQRVKHELAEIAGLAATPTYVEVNRWERGMPQYTLGHVDRLEKIENALRPYPRLYLTGAGYRGVGIPDCIRDGNETASRAVRDLVAALQ
jgi:oxygen-dependent protoporphyrinogen oxidase